MLNDHDKAYTATDAAAVLQCSPGHTRAALAALHDAAVIYINEWSRRIVGDPWIAAYAWCGAEPKPDAAHPRRG